MDFKDDKLDFKTIVLSHLKKILDLSTHEFRNTTFSIIKNDNVIVSRQEDTRISYIQSIENFAYVLLPHFDTNAKKVYDDCIKIIAANDLELIDDSKEYLSKLEKDSKTTFDLKQKKKYLLFLKVDYAKKLFCELNLLLLRKEYLKSMVMGESRDEIVTDG